MRLSRIIFFILLASIFVHGAYGSISSIEYPEGETEVNEGEIIQFHFQSDIGDYENTFFFLQTNIIPQKYDVKNYEVSYNGENITQTCTIERMDNKVLLSKDPLPNGEGTLNIYISVQFFETGVNTLVFRNILTGFNIPPYPPEVLDTETSILVSCVQSEENEQDIEDSPPDVDEVPQIPEPPTPDTIEITISGLAEGEKTKVYINNIKKSETTNSKITLEAEEGDSVSVEKYIQSNEKQRQVCEHNIISFHETPTIEFAYNQQFSFAVTESDDYVTISPTSQDGFYNEGQRINLIPGNREGYNWIGWEGKGDGSYNGSEKNIAITLHSAITQKPEWELIIEHQNNTTDSILVKPHVTSIEFPPRIIEGEEFEISISIENRGDTPQFEELIISVGETKKYRKPVHINSKSSATVTVRESLPNGEYVISAGDVSVTLVIEEKKPTNIPSFTLPSVIFGYLVLRKYLIKERE